MDAIKIELNIALAPDTTLGSKLTNWSQSIAKRTADTRVILGDGGARLSDVPHLTLYQVPILARDLDTLSEQLKSIASGENMYKLNATELTYNDGERSLEIGYETSDTLVALQENVIKIANKLRGDMLLEKDPAGGNVAALVDADGELGENIRMFGYSEIGGLFRPHATLNWFGDETDFDITTERRRNYSDANGAFDTLLISVLGSHGRCAQQLACHRLR